MYSIKNLRNLGGYPAVDGRTVRWNILYRSGHLGKVNKHDIRQLSDLGLHTIIDFRSTDEKQRHPDRLPEGHSIRVVELPILDEGNSAMIQDIRRRYAANDFDDLDTVKIMFNTYRQFALDFTAEYAQFIQAVLAAGGKPILWHCTAGKDRAGFASALLLRLLGADFSTILQDYMLSKKHVHPDHKVMIMVRFTKGAKPAHLLKPLWDVQAGWIKASFDAIEAHWGNFETYAHDALRLTTADLRMLQNTLLELNYH